MEGILRCKTCGCFVTNFKIKGKFEYDFICKRCKQKNTGIIISHDKKNKKIFKLK